jgi:predicted nucleotidyltransferase
MLVKSDHDRPKAAILDYKPDIALWVFLPAIRFLATADIHDMRVVPKFDVTIAWDVILAYKQIYSRVLRGHHFCSP